jgi:hypothetical protein
LQSQGSFSEDIPFNLNPNSNSFDMFLGRKNNKIDQLFRETESIHNNNLNEVSNSEIFQELARV